MNAENRDKPMSRFGKIFLFPLYLSLSSEIARETGPRKRERLRERGTRKIVAGEEEVS
jgi:hypothetical protein